MVHQVMWLPFEYWTPILSSIQIESGSRCWIFRWFLLLNKVMSDPENKKIEKVKCIRSKGSSKFSKFSAGFMQLSKNRPGLTRELVASWKFIYGDVNFRAMHLFKYPHVRTFLWVMYREHVNTECLNSANVWKPSFLWPGIQMVTTVQILVWYADAIWIPDTQWSDFLAIDQKLGKLIIH